MRLAIREPIDGQGRIRPVADNDYIGQPVVAHMVTMECGIYIFHGDQCEHFDSLSEAMGYVERLRA